MSQNQNPKKLDWVSYVIKLLEDMKINLTLEVIAKIKKSPFRNIVNKQVHKASFEYLKGQGYYTCNSFEMSGILNTILNFYIRRTIEFFCVGLE